jgi:hypothetical protein
MGFVETMKRLIIVAGLVLVSSARAQWTEPVRISYDLGLLGPSAVAVGETLHVAASGPTDIYYLKSTDNGQTWTDPIIPIPDSFDGSRMPNLGHSEDLLHLSCVVYFLYQRQQVMHFSSTNEGGTWSAPHQAFNNDSGFLKYPRIAVKGDTLFLSCVISSKLLTFTSFDSGETWGDSVAVENGPITIDHPPYILYSQERVHLIYQVDESFDTLGIEICYRYSNDYGQTWSDRRYLSKTENQEEGKDAQAPSAYADSSGNIMALWFDYEYGSECGVTGDILGRVSRDNGQSWLPITRLTNTQTGSRSTCLILNDRLHALWQDDYWNGCMDHKLTYAESSDWGENWTDPEVITGTTESDEYEPILMYNETSGDTIFHCVFRRDVVEGGYDLHYMRTLGNTGNSEETDDIRTGKLALALFPNPANSSVAIEFRNPEGGDLNIEIYNLLGQRIRLFTIEGAKEGRIRWDARDALGNKASSGIYFARARGAGGYAMVKLIYLR